MVASGAPCVDQPAMELKRILAVTVVGESGGVIQRHSSELGAIGIGVVQLGGQAELTPIQQHGGGLVSYSVGRGPVRHQQERQVVDPVASAFIGRSYHAYEGLVEALDGAHGLVMLGGGRAEVDSRCAHDGVAQLAGKVRAVVSDNAARRAVATDDVLHEQVEHLLGSRVFVDRDGFDPSGQRVDEDHELGGTCALFFVVVMRFSHGQDIGVQDVKRVVADRRTDGVTETAAGLGQGALVAL